MQLTLSEYILDIVQNSVEAGSTVITVDYLEESGRLEICIGDNGCGMNDETLMRVSDPFFTDGIKHAHRKVGLGIPFLKQAVELVEGEFEISSEEGTGTSVRFCIPTDHLDSPPSGDIPGLFRSLMLFEGTYDLLVYRKKEGEAYRVSRAELEDSLGDLYEAQSMMLMKDYFSSQEEELS